MRGWENYQCLGNIGADPETRYTGGGKAVVNFQVAVNRVWKNDKGEKQEATEWRRCRAWGRTGEIIAQHLKKGDPILITESRLQREEWEHDGKKDHATVVVVQAFQFVGGKKNDVPF